MSVATTSTSRGLLFGVLASLAFSTSGAFIKPLLESGWSPAAAVTLRAGIAAVVLLPIAVVSLRGRWAALWRARWRVLGMGLIGVAGTQLVYFASLQRIPVSTALLIEYLAPLLLVGYVWVTTRRAPRAVVIIGSVVAILGLVLVIGPGALGAAVDGLGLFFAALAAVGCAIYYVIAARPSDGLPPVAFAASGLLLGSVVLGVVGAVGLVPFEFASNSVALFGAEVAWWVPLVIVAVIGTAFAYVSSIAASEMLGSRLMSFVGLLEVVFASILAWILLGEALTLLQLLGGAAILAGIALVRSEKQADAPLEPGSVDELATGQIAVISPGPAPALARDTIADGDPAATVLTAPGATKP
ncbi:drug/metabolite transporter (DMT)-like permease [Microbacteriaceae bacterium SG_E_30_P1]|uniref:Drug/metabolite transporter (DMT)-like permease n=1 Tax=Antiquaquibacter oligotrophicus TaxID=2880260 RepID=A0ABT6KMY5_9MICO|nr:DMT family transporter [Antiquaquibacter oligotrophicus]MDH6181370.1 drug/metabolite transporter (DMT)-like permease [Antiquaquibacter oligotrophicus]UDF12937.1 DMT family transporter [Antiquaquibacter oligotrophicus]